MRKKYRVPPLLLALVLTVGLCLVPASAANLYFTGINDSVAPLTSGTMPCWFGGTLYVPYTVFDANQNGVGISLGLYTSYNRTNLSVTIFNLKHMLVFDPNQGTCRDEMTGAIYDGRTIIRNGKPYVPLSLVCSVFGLDYSYNPLNYISQGYLVRIKSADAVLNDALFIDRARDLINNRLRDYTQSLNPAEATPSAPSNPAGPAQVEENDVATYLAFRCERADGLPAILSALDNTGRCALFFLTPQVIEEEHDLVRRILGTGHSIGILAMDGEADTLARGRRALEELTHTRTTLAYVPEGVRDGTEESGWVCWKETLFLEPSDSVGGTAFANTVLNRLGTRRRTVCLTLEGSGNTARVLPALLRQLDSGHYTVAVPLETKL